MKFLAAITTAVTILASPISAATLSTFDVEGSFSGGQLGSVDFTIRVSGDFSSSITSTPVSSSTLSSSNIANFDESDVGGLNFEYFDSVGTLDIFGQDYRGVRSNETTFVLRIFNVLFNPNAIVFADSIGSQSSFGEPTLISFSVSEIAAVPLPAGLPLLAGSLLAFGLLRKRTVKAA